MPSWSKPKFRGTFSGGTARSGGATTPSTSGGGGGGGTAAPTPTQAAAQKYEAQTYANPVTQNYAGGKIQRAAVEQGKKSVIVTLGKKEGGGYTVENVGKDLTPTEKVQVSRAIVTATTQARAEQAYREQQARLQTTRGETRTALLGIPGMTGAAAFTPAVQQRTVTVEQPMSKREAPFVEMFGYPSVMTSATTGKPTASIPPSIVRASTTPPEKVIAKTPKAGSQFKHEFWSWEGQGERFSNAGKAILYSLASPFTSNYKIEAYVDNAYGKRILEAAANNPYTTALVVAGGYGAATGGLSATAGAGFVPKVATLATSTIPKVAVVGATTYWGGVAIAESGQASTNKQIAAGFREEGGISVEASRAGFAAEKAANKKTAWYKQAGYQVPIASLFVQNEDAYIQGATDYLKSKGYSGSRLDNALAAARAMRISQSVSEGGAFLSTSAADELIGRSAVKARFGLEAARGTTIAKTGIFNTKLFKIGFSEIAPIGFAEGSIQESVQQEARGEKGSFLKQALMGGFGFVSAGTIGGFIMGLAPTPRGVTPKGALIDASLKAKTPRKAVEVASYLADPFEYPGDVLADISEGSAKRIAKVTGLKAPHLESPALVFNIPVITNTATISFSSSTGTPLETRKGKVGKPSVPAYSPTLVEQPRGKGRVLIPSIYIPSVEPEAVAVPSGRKKTTVPPYIPDVGIPTSPDVPTPQVPTTPETPVPTQPDIPEVGTPIEVPTITQTNIWTAVPVPVLTPLVRFPPPLALPAWGGIGGGGVGTRGGKGRNLYVNELAAGQALMASFMGRGKKPKQAKPLLLGRRKATKTEKRLAKKQSKRLAQVAGLMESKIDLPEIFDKSYMRQNKYMRFVPKIM